MADTWWEEISLISNNNTLRQGDYLLDCSVVNIRADFDVVNEEGKDRPIVDVDKVNLIVVTQSCDLENKNVSNVLFSPIYLVTEFTEINPNFNNKRWEEVRKGRIEGLYLLASTDNPEDPHKCLVVDFREVYSLPYEYLVRHTQTMDIRCRLKSPYLEHFSQAFARRFMRVGLPSAIPPFK
jgi:hypothetical protein